MFGRWRLANELWACLKAKSLTPRLLRAKWKLGIKFIREALLLSQEMQKEPPCFLNFLGWGLGVAGSNYLLHSIGSYIYSPIY